MQHSFKKYLLWLLSERGTLRSCLFAKFSKRKQLRLPRQNLSSSSATLQPKAKAFQPSTHAFLTKGNFSMNAKKKKDNVDKREVLQAHAIQIQTLQNELESLMAQLVNLKGKFSQPASHAQHVHDSRSRERPPRLFFGFSHDAMVGEYVFPSTHNFSFTPKFATFFFPFYFVAQEVNVAPKVSATR